MDANIALQQTRQHFRRLGLSLPAAFLKDLSDIDAVLDKAGPNPTRKVDLTTAAWDALAAGRDLLADKAITDELMAGLLAQQNLGPRLQQHANDLRAQVLIRHAEKILAVMTDVVTAADEALTAAHSVIDELDIASPSAVAAVTPRHVPAWSSASDAANQLDSVRQVWTYIVQACRLAPIPPSTRELALIFVDLSLDELDALQIDAHRSASLTTAIAHSGRHLDYATPAEFAERSRRINEERAERAAKRAVEKQNAGFGL